MQQIQTIIDKLKNPSVILSIVSEVIAILMLLNIDVDANVVTSVVTGICSILVLLGILSDPNTENKGYGDDLLNCEHCNKLTRHVLVNGKLVCKECGHEYKEERK